MPWPAFRDLICDKLGIDPASANLYYKLEANTSRSKVLPLGSEEQYTRAIADLCAAIYGARIRDYIIEVHNKVCKYSSCDSHNVLNSIFRMTSIHNM